MIRGRMDIIRIITFFRWWEDFGLVLLKRFDFSINIVEWNIFQKIIRYCVVVVLVVLLVLRQQCILYYKM